MSKRQWFIAKFDNHTDYETFKGDTTRFVKPNVSRCVEDNHVHYNPIGCEETEIRAENTSYTPTYIESYETSFPLQIFYSSTSTTTDCTETYGNGVEYITIQCEKNTTGSDRRIEGYYNYYGRDLYYWTIQRAEDEYTIKGFFTTTSDSQSVRLASSASAIEKMEVDGTVITNREEYIYSTIPFTGEHECKMNALDVVRSNTFDEAEYHTILISDNVKGIETRGFASLPNLTTLKIGSSLEYINERGLEDNSALKNIYCYTMVAPTLGNNVFDGAPSGGTLYVPTGATGYDAWLNQLSNWTLKYI